MRLPRLWGHFLLSLEVGCPLPVLFLFRRLYLRPESQSDSSEFTRAAVFASPSALMSDRSTSPLPGSWRQFSSLLARRPTTCPCCSEFSGGLWWGQIPPFQARHASLFCRAQRLNVKTNHISPCILSYHHLLPRLLQDS